jgi:hypothetical protein
MIGEGKLKVALNCFAAQTHIAVQTMQQSRSLAQFSFLNLSKEK